MGKSKIDFSSEEFGRKKRKVKYTSFLFVLLTLGVNIFAWFTYVTSASLQIDASVAAWDVVFTDDSGQTTNTAIINIHKMLPGMEPYSRKFRVRNQGEVAADFNYVVKSIELFGKVTKIEEESNEQVINDLKNKYPFSVSFVSPKNSLDIEETINFEVKVDWNYDSEDVIYYKLDDNYEYDSTLKYYVLDNNMYTEAIVDSSNFLALRDSLYLDKDSADSYFGEKCGEYESRTKNACLKLKLDMIVQQRK